MFAFSDNRPHTDVFFILQQRAMQLSVKWTLPETSLWPRHICRPQTVRRRNTSPEM